VSGRETKKRESEMMNRITRRATLGGTIAALAAPAIAQSRRKVTLVYGVPVIDSSAEGFFASVPLGMGFYAEEGLDVEIQTVSGASAAINLLISGQAQFSTHGTGGMMSAASRGVPIQGFCCQVPEGFTSVAVLKDGGINSFADLKGKTIGISALGGAPTFTLNAVMRRLGWDPKSDVEMIAVGASLPALDALKRGRVQALVEWDSIFALMEFNGASLRYFRPDPMPTIGFQHCSNTLLSTVEKDPALVAAMARALAKSLVVMATAPPEELAKLHFKMFPASRPTLMSDADILRLDGLRLAARKQFMHLDQRVIARTEKIGDIDYAVLAGMRDLLFEGGELQQSLPPERYFTKAFMETMNAIDVQAISARAKAFRV
jgi:NitT/TauT family transport system substrate-binding protein